MCIRRCVVVVVPFVGLMLPIGCSGDGGASVAKKESTFRIAVIPKGTTHDFWKSVEAGARQAGKEYNDIEVTWKGPLSEADTSDQIKTVENFIMDGYDAICLAPLDAQALRKPVDQAIEAGIPVIIFDSALRDPAGTISYVASDNFQGGRLAGEYLAELLGGEGNVILLRYQINSESTEERERGFLEAIGEHPGIKLISSDQYAGADEDNALKRSQNLLLNFGDEVDGIFCPNESSASGMLTALRQHGDLAGKVKFVGFDGSANLITGLKNGELHGTVLQDPYEMGYMAVRTARDHLKGKPYKPRIATRLTVAKHDALDAPGTIQLLGPSADR